MNTNAAPRQVFLLAAFATLVIASFALGTSRKPDAAEQAPAHEFAVCDLLKIADELMQTDRFKPVLKEAWDKANQDDAAATKRLEAMRKEAEGTLPSDPKYLTRVDAYNAEVRAIEALRSRTREQLAKLSRDQISQAYKLVRDSSILIAQRRGFSYLLQSIAPDSEFRQTSELAFNTELAGRTVILSPAETDITEDVRAELHLR